MPPRLISTSPVELFPMANRSKGMHVSTAIHSVMEELYPDRFDGSPINIVRANFGNALERAIIQGLSEAHPNRYVRPGELELDDIYGTPDLWDLLVDPTSGSIATCEFKLTWASSSRAEDIEDAWFWRYWTQLKSYCYMGGHTRGRLMVGFINGNYRRNDPEGSAPCVYEWEDEWTEEELAENWEMIKARAWHAHHGDKKRKK